MSTLMTLRSYSTNTYSYSRLHATHHCQLCNMIGPVMWGKNAIGKNAIGKNAIGKNTIW